MAGVYKFPSATDAFFFAVYDHIDALEEIDCSCLSSTQNILFHYAIEMLRSMLEEITPDELLEAQERMGELVKSGEFRKFFDGPAKKEE